MDDRQKELLMALADALELAGAATRALAEYEPDTVTLKVDAESVGQLIRALYQSKTEPC